MARMKMSGLFGLAAAGLAAWWVLGRRASAAPALPVIDPLMLEGPGVQSASLETLSGLKAAGKVPPDAQDVYLVPNLPQPLMAVGGAPGVYAIPSNLMANGGAGAPVLLSGMRGFGARPLTVMRTTPSFANRRPGSLTLMSTPRMPSPRSLSGGLGFGQPVGWHAGQLYQPGTHDTTSGVTGLWY